MPVSEQLNAAQSRHQIAVTRYVAGQAKTIDPYMRQVIAYIEQRLAKEGQSITTKKRLNILLKDAKAKLDSIYSKWEAKEFQRSITETIQNEIEFQQAAINRVVVDYETIVPTAEQAYVAATRNPLLIGSQGGAVDFAVFTKQWKADEINRVAGRISGGFYAGETTQEIVRGIVGTKSQRYADGLVNVSRRNVQTMVRTTLNHMAVQAKEEIYKQNDDLIIGYEIVATLDSVTSQTCKFYDGQIFYYRDGRNQPKPSFHFSCRSSTSPVLSDKFDFLDKDATRASKGAEGGKQVSADLTYFQWLKSQPAEFQDMALGKTRGKIFRNAGLSPEEFRKASAGQLGRPLTIDQMKAKDKRIAEYLN